MHQEQELFEQYELKGWQVSPRLYKVLGASVLVNLVLFAFIAQANFLTGKTCDSPLASGLCSVLDTLYVGSMIAANETIFTDKPYTPTEIADAEDIKLVEYTPPLEYPAGYFAMVNPTQFETLPTDQIGGDFPATGNIPGITPTTPNFSPINPTINTPNPTDLSKVQQVLPKKKKNVIDGNLDDLSINDTIAQSDRKKTQKSDSNKSESNSTVDENKTVANNNNNQTEDKSEPVAELEINRKPLEDFGDSVNARLEKNEVDLTKPFTVVMSGEITNDGKLDTSIDKKTKQPKSKFVFTEGDEQMVNVAKEAIEAIGNSGFLGYLKNQGIDKAELTIEQNDKEINIRLVSILASDAAAKSKASGFGVLLGFVKGRKLDPNSELLVKNAVPTSEGKNFVLTVIIPKQEAQALINKSLNDRREKKKQQLNSSAEVNSKTATETGR